MPSAITKDYIFTLVADALGEPVVAGKIKRLLENRYEQTRDSELRKNYWNFAMSRAEVAADAVRPAFGWLYRYEVPSDFIALLPPTEDGRPESATILYTLEGRFILTDKPAPLRFRYTARQTTVGYFDPLFVDALVARLAMDLAHNITGKNSYVDRATAAYDKALEGAEHNDAIENPRAYPEPSEVIAARYI